MKFLLVDNGLPFDLDTLDNSSLGGSETSLLLLGKGLSELGHSVVILNNRNTSPSRGYNIIIDNINLLSNYAEISDIIISNRIDPRNFAQFNKLIYYYNHDAYDQEVAHWMSIPDALNACEKILCVSEWQKNTFKKYLNVDESKMIVIGNPIEPVYYAGYAKRNPLKLIFAGIPYKGLEVLNDLFSDLCIRTQLKLEMDIFSSMKLYNQEDTDYEKAFSDLSKNKGVSLHDPCSMKELAFHLLRSSVYLSPNTYHETFGMLLVQAQAAGCIPVATNNGAMNEVIYSDSQITKGRNIEDSKTYEEFMNIIEKSLVSTHKDRLQAKEFSNKFSYNKIVKLFLKEIL